VRGGRGRECVLAFLNIRGCRGEVPENHICRLCF
jgi:hypothetical protein